MADDFGLKIALEGEKEFKKALSEINQSFKVLGSEMKLTESQFSKNDNSVEALTEKNKVLGKEIDAQKGKIETLRSALENATSAFGENDRRTQAWQIQLNNAEASLNDMERELKENEEAIKNNGKEAEEASGKFEGFGTVCKATAAAIGAAAIAAGAAAIKLGSEVIKSFGELEQNLGGSEAVFGEYAANVQKIGEEAYKNMGVSQSQYLATANKMGALFQGSGVEQQKSMELTTKAMQRAADMASVMGIDMQVALDSVAGAAKGNFTMMDNLGVSMNATAIEAYAASKGLDFVWKSATQAEKAEMAMQMFFENTEQYAGNFANEATQTVSGSIGLLQAALGSFTAGLGNANADMTNLTANLVDAFNAVVANLVPVIENIVTALPIALQGLLGAVGDLLPTLLETVTTLFSQILNTILTLLPQLIPAVVQAVLTIVQALVDNLPLLVEAAVQLVTTLVTGIASALPQLIPAAVNAIITIVKGLVDSLPMILDAALQLITGLAQGLLNAIPVLIQALPEIIMSIIQFILDAIPQIIDTGIQLLTSLVAALPEIITAIVEAIPQIISGIISAVMEAIPQIIQAGIDLLISLIQALPQIITTIVQAIPQIISGIVNAVIGNIDKIIMAGVQLFVALIQNLPTIIVEIVKAVPQIITGLVNAIISFVPKLAETGLNLIKGLWNGIKDAGAWLWDKISGFFGGVVDKIKNFFGIHSPSTLFASFGGFMAEGLGEGFGDEMGTVSDDMTAATAEAGDATGAIAVEAIKNGILNHMEELGEPINALIMKIAEMMQKLMPEIMTMGTSADEALAEGISEGGEETVLTQFRSLMDKIISFFASVGREFVSIGQRIMEGIGEGITSRSSWLNRLMQSYIREMKARVESMLGIHSPSRVFAKIGGYMAEGMGVGFTKEMNTVRKQMENAIPTTLSGVGNFSTADLVNGLVGGLSPMLAGAGGQSITLKVNLDGKTVAKSVFDPLKDVSKQRGVSLG